MQIEFTPTQAQMLLQFCDLIVRNVGIQAAKDAYELAVIIQEAINRETPAAEGAQE
jgi:hypothetical protein